MKCNFMLKCCVVAVALLLCFACREENDARYIVLYGDSITAEYGAPEGSYTQLVQQKFHADTVYRHGYCGHRYSRDVSAAHGGPSWLGTYVGEVCSHADADLIILFAGTNDYGHGMPLGEPGDTATTRIAIYIGLPHRAYRCSRDVVHALPQWGGASLVYHAQ